MPIEFTPPRRLLNAFLRLRERQRGRDGGPDTAPKLTVETVETVNDDGTYQVRGATLRPTGLAQMEAGQGVTVAWKQGTPKAIVAHQVQRAQFPQAPTAAEPGVEMLLAGPTAAGDVTGTKLDVWFRNQNQTTLLNVREKIATAGFVGGAPGFTSIIGLELLGWSLDQRRFAVSFTNPVAAGVNKPIIAVFKFNNERTTITAPAKAVLERAYDLSALTNVLGTSSWAGTRIGIGSISGSMMTTLGVAASVGKFMFIFPTSPTTVEIRNSDGPPGNFAILQTVFAGVAQAVLRKDKHLIVNFNVTVTNAPDGEGTAPLHAWTYPFVVDVTAGTVLLNGFDARNNWPPFSAQLYDGLNFSTLTFDSMLSFRGGTAVRMVPTPGGNVLRFFATGTGQAGNGATFKWAGARINLGPLVLVFQESSSGTTVGAGVRSANSRHVMWLRIANVVPPASLSSYDFKEGLHITDLGAGEALAVTDAVVLADRDSIIALMDETPYLVRPRLLWLGTNDLRTVEPAGAATLASLLAAAGLAGVSAGPRRKTRFASYTTQNGFPKVPIAPPASGSPLSIVVPTGAPAAADLKPIPAKSAFLAVDVLDNYDVSGHQDPVVGAEQYVDFRSRVQYMTPTGQT